MGIRPPGFEFSIGPPPERSKHAGVATPRDLGPPPYDPLTMTTNEKIGVLGVADQEIRISDTTTKYQAIPPPVVITKRD